MGSTYGWWAGVYQDNLYLNTDNYSHRSDNTKEIVTWGEMLGVGMPDDHERIVNWYKTNCVTSTGYDLPVHEAAMVAYNHFLDRWNFRSSFPTASRLFNEIGKKSYFFWQKIMENGRMSDANDFLVISGWESTMIENHSGIVDAHRNLRADPAILKQAMNPEVLVIRPKRLVLKPGELASVDIHLINEISRAGVQTLSVTAHNPDGSILFSQQTNVLVAGGDVFGQVLETDFTFRPTTGGTVLVEGALQAGDGTGNRLTNQVELLVFFPETLAAGWFADRFCVELAISDSAHRRGRRRDASGSRAQLPDGSADWLWPESRGAGGRRSLCD